MASFDKYSNYNEKTSFSSVVFGSEKPVLEVELNELQQIIATKIERICSVLGNGYYPISDSNVSLSGTTLTVSGGVILLTDLIALVSECSVTVSDETPYVYFEVEEVEATLDSVLHAYGNTSGEEIDNLIQDSRIPIETTRRKVVVYTLKAGVKADLTDVNYVGVGTYDNSTFTVEKVGLDKISTDLANLVVSLSAKAPTNNPVFTGSISLGRKANTSVGNNSVALGYNNVASGEYSLAFGEGNTASKLRAIAIGYNNTASGGHSFAFGSNNTASGTGANASGYKTNASADYSYAEGNLTKATGYYAHAMGTNTVAKQNQLAIGSYNDDALSTENSLSGTGTGTVFVIGNGTSSAKSNALRVQADGVTYAKGAYNSTGADYAEFAEWADGNPNNEDRRGYFVTFDEEKPNMIRKAKASDVSVLGVVSGNPCIIGNSDESWLGRYMFDEFGSPIYETYEETTIEKDSETGEKIETTRMVTHYKLNPLYDPSREYLHRSERPEWSAVGWIGVLSVRDDGTCEVGGYCTWSDDGLATSAEPSRLNYRVLERVNDNIVKVAIK